MVTVRARKVIVTIFNSEELIPSSVEAQIVGVDAVGGIQIEVIPFDQDLVDRECREETTLEDEKTRVAMLEAEKQARLNRGEITIFL